MLLSNLAYKMQKKCKITHWQLLKIINYCVALQMCKETHWFPVAMVQRCFSWHLLTGDTVYIVLWHSQKAYIGSLWHWGIYVHVNKTFFYLFRGLCTRVLCTVNVIFDLSQVYVYINRSYSHQFLSSFKNRLDNKLSKSALSLHDTSLCSHCCYLVNDNCSWFMDYLLQCDVEFYLL